MVGVLYDQQLYELAHDTHRALLSIAAAARLAHRSKPQPAWWRRMWGGPRQGRSGGDQSTRLPALRPMHGHA